MAPAATEVQYRTYFDDDYKSVSKVQKKVGLFAYLLKRQLATKAPRPSPATLNVGLVQRTRELSRATRVQSISARQTAKMSVT